MKKIVKIVAIVVAVVLVAAFGRPDVAEGEDRPDREARSQ